MVQGMNSLPDDFCCLRRWGYGLLFQFADDMLDLGAKSLATLQADHVERTTDLKQMRLGKTQCGSVCRIRRKRLEILQHIFQRLINLILDPGERPNIKFFSHIYPIYSS